MNLVLQKKFPCTVLRLYQVYGPFQDYNGFISFVIKSCIKNDNFLVLTEINLETLYT